MTERGGSMSIMNWGVPEVGSDKPLHRERYVCVQARIAIASPPTPVNCTPPCPSLPPAELGKGQMASALTGSLRISCVLTEGPFGYSR